MKKFVMRNKSKDIWWDYILIIIFFMYIFFFWKK
jgi:hypothetical protein